MLVVAALLKLLAPLICAATYVVDASVLFALIYSVRVVLALGVALVLVALLKRTAR